jgi:hypothetical protein
MSNICENVIQPIDFNETIGLSLFTINNNFSLLKEKICSLDTTLQVAQEQFSLTNTTSVSLSSQRNVLIKARVSFDCTRDINGVVNNLNTDRYIYPGTNFNVIRVTRQFNSASFPTNTYNIQLPNNLVQQNAYAIFGTCSPPPEGAGFWVHPLTTGYSSSNATISILNTTGIPGHPNYVSILII